MEDAARRILREKLRAERSAQRAQPQSGCPATAPSAPTLSPTDASDTKHLDGVCTWTGCVRVTKFDSTPGSSFTQLYDPEHCFPYTSAGDTSELPHSHDLPVVGIQNDSVRVLVAPTLGGRVWQFRDLRGTQETDVVFCNPAIRPVRILPVWDWCSGGIEFNFPIAHSPTSSQPVAWEHGIVPASENGGRAYAWIRVGETGEARYGMDWLVEVGVLSGEDPVIYQRTCIRNCTDQSHPFMFWTNCAVPAHPTTQFMYPAGPALLHSSTVTEDPDWGDGGGAVSQKRFQTMTGVFWKNGQGDRFGAVASPGGPGLLHLANPSEVPGKKLWSYGEERDAVWAESTTIGGLRYAEVQSGRLFDQAQKPLLHPGDELRFSECWVALTTQSEFYQPGDDVLARQLPELGPDPYLRQIEHSPVLSQWSEFVEGRVDGSGPEFRDASISAISVAVDDCIPRAPFRRCHAASVDRDTLASRVAVEGPSYLVASASRLYPYVIR